MGTISFGINLFLFGNTNGNLSNRAIEAYPFQIETIGKVSICGGRGNSKLAQLSVAAGFCKPIAR
ncbi:MAG: hypothetical protein AUI02_03540 [Acidobacteria bacterium 13_2_20CM_2_57_12]|nr:MAG: hypothetical protein AUI02_03540 [Acidobacteria bacterium 13_2_20CM_2_57_12]